MKKETAATEVIGFIIVMAIVILGLTIWGVIALPIQGENKEVTHNDEVLLEMSNLKYNIDTLLINKIRYSTRFCFVSNSPKGDKAVVTLLPELSTIFSTGTVVIEAGEKISSDYNYNKLKITFTSHNMYADNIKIEYDGGDLYSYSGENKLKLLSGISEPYENSKYIPAVNSDFTTMTLSGNEFSVIIFRLDDRIAISHVDNPEIYDQAGIFSIDVKGSYYG